MSNPQNVSLARPRAEDPYAKLVGVASMSLSSEDFLAEGTLPLAHVAPSAGGEGVSPQLTWSGAPEGTASFALTCFDPDAPTPSGFWHWAVLDLPASATALPRAATELPGHAFTLGNDAGTIEYAGAAPPPGDAAHRYYFVVHAVDVPHLGVPRDASPAVLSFQLAFHTLARGVLVATFGR